jgi:hypothetical protein
MQGENSYIIRFLDIFTSHSEYYDFAVGEFVFVFIAFVEVCHSNGLPLFRMGWELGVQGLRLLRYRRPIIAIYNTESCQLNRLKIFSKIFKG